MNDDDQAAGGYYSYSLGYRNDAVSSLTGPGSSAVGAVQSFSPDGHITSYASEGENGAVFEQTKLYSPSSYEVATGYRYGQGYIFYGSDYGTVGQNPFFNPHSENSYSDLRQDLGTGYTSYRAFDDVSTPQGGGYDLRTSSSLTYRAYGDGSYYEMGRSSSGLFTYGGHLVAGTSESASYTVSYDAGTGYLSTSHTP